MFSSNATEENFQVSARWLLGLPRVFTQFGHTEKKMLPASVTINMKGGADSCVLAQVLKRYVTTLFPYVDDTTGKGVLFK